MKKEGNILDKILKDVKSLNEEGTSLLSDIDPFKDVKGWISTGVPGLNYFLSTYGFPMGEMIEISGKEQSGKSTLSWHCIERAQKTFDDMLIVVLATERRSRSGYASIIGVDESRVIVEKPRTIEKVFSTIDYWIAEVREKYSKKLPLFFIWDSLGGTATKAEKEAEADKEFMAIAARVIKRNVRKLIPDMDDFNVTFLIINQIYDKMQVFGSGKRTTTYGGKAVKFHGAVRLQLTDIGQIKIKDDKIGQRVMMEVLKCDYCSPNKKIEFPLLYGIGFVPNYQDLKFAEKVGLLEKYKKGYQCNFNKKWKWTSEAKYFMLMKEDAKFRRSFINLLDIKYKKEILKNRKKEVEENE